MLTTKLKKDIKTKSKCCICGESNPILLEFDHINPLEKIQQNFKRPSVKRLKIEIEKCRIICIWCHRIHSKNQREEDYIIKSKSMTYTEEENNMVLDELAKKCNGILCNNKKRPSVFFNIRKRNNKPNGKCKKCLYFDGRYKKDINKNHINNLKLSIGKCEMCNIEVGKDTTCCFDFDHIDIENKLSTISLFTCNRKNCIKEIDEEVKKCRLLCCKCHRLYTADQLKFRNWII